MGGLRLPEPYRGLPRSIYVLFFANIVNSLGSFVWPFLTLYLTERLGMSKHGAGQIVTLSALAYVPGSLFGGKIADHLGRKRVFVVSRLLGALALVPCAFLGVSPLIPWLLIATSLLSAAVDPALSAMVADLTTRRNRQGAFSLLYLGHNIGFAVGPILAGLLYRHHLPWLFLGDALTTVLSVLLVVVFVRETLPQHRTEEAEGVGELPEQERAEKGGLLLALWRRPAVLLFSLVLMVYSFVYVQHAFSLPVQMRALFPENGPALYGVLMSVNAVTVVLFTTLITRVTSRFDSTLNIVLGGLFYAAGFGMIALIRGIPLFVLSVMIWTFGEIMVATNSSVYLANHTPISHRGRFRAVLDIVSGTGWAMGPLFMGRLIDRAGVRAVWPLCFLLGLGGSALMVALWGAERTRPVKPAEPDTVS
ncbi:MAG: MFS transporter [Bacillota bacterium]|nr:MFS transporter [Bacillota bacterium]